MTAHALQPWASRFAALFLPLLLALTLGACASSPPAAPGSAAAAPMGTNPADPWEAFNRKMFSFNDAIDGAILKPVATAYRAVVPELVRQGVGNVLSNIGDVWSAANQLLQGKLEHGLNMGMRVLANSFFGLGGLLDPATEMGLTRRSEDFGQTLGVWGIGPGPYLVLPLFGPRTVRDTFGTLVDRNFEPSTLPSHSDGRYAVTALALINTRTNFLSMTEALDSVALDRYTFVRDAYLARRLDAVYDGSPPMEKFEDEPDSPATPASPASGASAPAAAPKPKP
jgi:phospholipid-binding lipoprotein MlaA